MTDINSLVLMLLETEHHQRSNLTPGTHVLITLKKDQRTDILTYGQVDKLLTSKPVHTRGIKVRLMDGQVGRVQKILPGPIQTMPFKSEDYNSLIEDLEKHNKITTLRIENEKDKYKLHEVVRTEFKYYLEVSNIQSQPPGNSLTLLKIGKFR